MENLTKEGAKALCVKKWEYLVRDSSEESVLSINTNVPETKELLFDCGYCEKYRKKPCSCRDCPLYILWGRTCSNPKSLHSRWGKSTTEIMRKLYAKIILRDIKRS